MMKSDLSITGCWIEPHSDLSYMDDAFLKIEFKNESDVPIDIEKVTCSFQTEKGLSPLKFSLEPMITVLGGHISQIVRISFFVDLKLHFATNYALIEAEYRKNHSKESHTISFDFPESRYVIIHNIHSPEKHFLISHKDPENTNISEKLDLYLKKIGFAGYVAENDPSPGLDIWEEKVIPAINTCSALIVLWTNDAIKNPSNIFREMNYAKKQNKRIITLSEKIELPEIFQGTNEYTTVDEIDDENLIQLVDNIYKNYRKGIFEN